jgi:hypothetical protein
MSATPFTLGQQLKLQRRFASVQSDLAILREELNKLGRDEAGEMVNAAMACLESARKSNLHNDRVLNSSRDQN